MLQTSSVLNIIQVSPSLCLYRFLKITVSFTFTFLIFHQVYQMLLMPQSFNRYPSLLIYLKTLQYYILYFKGQLCSKTAKSYWVQDLLSELYLILTVRVRSTAMKKLINKDSKGPDIGFRTINILNKSLRSHIDRRADINIPEIN